MISAWTISELRSAEEVAIAAAAPAALMQRAAAGVATVCAKELTSHTGGLSGRRVVALIGAGNNGGDALYAAARLARRGVRVALVLLAPRERVHAAALAAALGAGCVEAGAAKASERGVDLVIDGIVGLGGTPGLRPEAVEALTMLGLAAPPHGRDPSGGGPSGGGPNSRGEGAASGQGLGVAKRPRVVSVDLPSGVDPQTGELPEPDAAGRERFVRADVSVTFGAAKPCLLLPPAALVSGRIVVVDIGLRLDGPPAVQRLEPHDVGAIWPRPELAAQKYSRGVLGVVAGSVDYPGAAVLAAGGALRSGAVGMVRYVGPAPAARRVVTAWPEVVVGQGRVQAWSCGSGVPVAPAGTHDSALAEHQLHRDWITHAVGSGLPVVADAGALAMLPERCGPQVVLTPHAGELAALLTALRTSTSREDVEAAPLAHARRAVELTGATVLLKGPVTIVADARGVVYSQADGTPWLATAGAGDVLSGVLGAALAAGIEPARAAAAAALVHGLAAREAAVRGPIVASDVIDALPGVICELLGGYFPV